MQGNKSHTPRDAGWPRTSAGHVPRGRSCAQPPARQQLTGSPQPPACPHLSDKETDTEKLRMLPEATRLSAAVRTWTLARLQTSHKETARGHRNFKFSKKFSKKSRPPPCLPSLSSPDVPKSSISVTVQRCSRHPGTPTSYHRPPRTPARSLTALPWPSGEGRSLVTDSPGAVGPLPWHWYRVLWPLCVSLPATLQAPWGCCNPQNPGQYLTSVGAQWKVVKWRNDITKVHVNEWKQTRKKRTL